MQNLLIEQRGPQGLIKTWRLRSEQGTVTFGASKHADLRSPVETVKGIQGVFEYREDKWYYINLDLHTNHSNMGKDISEMCLDQCLELKIGVDTLHVTPLDVRAPLFESISDEEISHSGKDRQPFQFFTVHQGPVLLETRVIPVHGTFVSKFDDSRTKFKPEKADAWKKTQVGDVTISQRTVYLNDVEALKHTPKGALLDDGGKKTLYATLCGAALIALMAILTPKEEALEDVLTPMPPIQREARIEPPKKKKQSAPMEQPKEQPKQQQQAAAPKNNGGGSSKSASVIKSLASGRITQLVGKVSAAAARSQNVVVTSGIKAGSAPTGRALAAVGAINKSGKDWSAEGKGTGVTISTSGKAGGQGTAGMGNLAVGKTGSGGVGLLEDEGEITGGLDREVIAAYIKSQLGQILYCYERQLSANPDLYGKVAIKFTIAGDGGVETQRIGETSLRNATVEGCILQRVAKWKFPTPEGGTKVLVTYPFLFKSTN